MDEKKIEEVVELKEEVEEMKEVSETASGKPNYILAGIGVLLGVGVLFMLVKKFAGKIKDWNGRRKAKKEQKKWKKDAEKHPENYITSDDVDLDESKDETTE